ncbi:SpoVR family protein [Litorivivens sp.]|uniref:SpoVR family protein n=3 Tax=Litorivivens sp. TaxID=2020868 RepID=UPI0035665814
MSSDMNSTLADTIPKMEALAKDQGLDFFPVDFELVPPSFMMEVAVYGLPVRMPHWSFGLRWIYQMIQHRMGHSKIFEVVFPGNPNRAYLVNTNSLHENTLVVAHVLGHADFSRNNISFARSQEQVGYHIVEQAAAHAHRIDEVIKEFGEQRVEQVLDCALSLEPHIDTQQLLNRKKYPTKRSTETKPAAEGFHGRYAELPGEEFPSSEPRTTPLPVPPKPEKDLLWFIANYAPEMEDWERDIFLAVRKEAWYFQPVFNCQIMNEGWASYWHSRLLREADFLPSSMYVDCMKTHSDVVSPYAGDQQVALKLNPYHVGYVMWEKIIAEQGLETARRIMEQEDDFGFIRNHLSRELADDMRLFSFNAKRNGEIKVAENSLDTLHENILAPKFNFGAPRVVVDELKPDGSLVLRHESGIDGRGLELERARKVLTYIANIWKRPVKLITLDAQDQEVLISPPENAEA